MIRSDNEMGSGRRRGGISNRWDSPLPAIAIFLDEERVFCLTSAFIKAKKNLFSFPKETESLPKVSGLAISPASVAIPRERGVAYTSPVAALLTPTPGRSRLLRAVGLSGAILAG